MHPMPGLQVKRSGKLKSDGSMSLGWILIIPLSDSAKNYQKILNKTHFNTTEKIIRKNLLFSEGDSNIPADTE